MENAVLNTTQGDYMENAVLNTTEVAKWKTQSLTQHRREKENTRKRKMQSTTRHKASKWKMQ